MPLSGRSSRAVPATPGLVRRPSTALSLSLLGLALAASGCGGSDGPAGPTPPEVPQGPQEATAPTLSTSQLAPLHALYLQGLPAGRTDFLAELWAAGASSATVPSAYFLPLVPEPDGRYRLHVLTHPTAGAGGGVVDVRVRGEDFVTAPARFTLAPLPPAPGRFAALLDSLQAGVDLELAALGLSRAELLAAGRAGTEPNLAPLAMIQTLLDDPSHDLDLRDLLNGSAGLAQITGGAQVDRDLLDRLAGAGNLEGILGDWLAAQRSAPPAGVFPGRGWGPSRADAMNLNDITTARALDRAMHLAWQSKAVSNPDAAPAQLLSAYGLALTGIGVATGPVGSAVATALSAFIFLLQLEQERIAKTYPSEFVGGSMQFDASPVTFKEDEPGPGEFTSVMVSAMSEDWELDTAALNFAILAAGSVRSAANFSRWVSQGAQGGAVDIANNIVGALAGTAGSMIPGGGGILRQPARIFPDIDISAETWITARLAGSSIKLGAHPTYDPVATGPTILTVETRPARFGGATPALSRQTITVETLSVEIEVDRTTVSPGETVELQVTVEEALDPGLRWTLSPGASWIYGPELIGENIWRAVILTPDLPELFPVRTTFTSTASGGARSAAGAPERSATQVINLGAILVEPPTALLEPGDTINFQAIVLGLANKEVTWSAARPDGTPVDIGTDGQFVAPASMGDYIITATSVADPLIKGFAVVTVAGRCQWTLNISGPSGGRWSGTEGGFIYLGAVGPSTNFGIYFSRGDEDPLIGAVQGSGPETAGQVGSFSPVGLGFSPAIGIQWTPMEGGTLNVIENEFDVMRATANGRVFTVESGPTIIEADWSLTFRGINGLGDLECSG